jgi:hypothetical protein
VPKDTDVTGKVKSCVVGDSPRGPLKQWGKTHLNRGTETR